MSAIQTVSSAPLQVSSVGHWQWLGFFFEPAEATMNRDRELIETVKRDRIARLRFYRWPKPTLSYGRTQGIEPNLKKSFVDRGYEVVRRPTGGGIVLHENDLCFSLIWTKGHRSMPWKINDSYCAIHRWIQKSLDELGFKTDLCPAPLAQTKEDQAWCFKSPVPFDVMAGGKKLAGGAQWRDGGVALHQGSLQISPDQTDLSVFKKNFCESFGTLLIE